MSRDAARREVLAQVAAELAQPVHPAVRSFVEALVARGPGVRAVLFYGSCLRATTLDGLLDFYLLVDSLPHWHGRLLPALANALLPPNVFYLEQAIDGQLLRAKVAVMTPAQFHARCTGQGLDTTIWARFAQPARLVWAVDDAATRAAGEAVATAVIAAARWAARLVPGAADAQAFWSGLFARTYGAEIRVETGARGALIAQADAARYDALLLPAWAADGRAAIRNASGDWQPARRSTDQLAARLGWPLRGRLGKALHFLRLVKNAYTFDGGLDYVIWKIERHSGYRLELSDWQRRHPILAAPGVIRRLRAQGVLH